MSPNVLDTIADHLKVPHQCGDANFLRGSMHFLSDVERDTLEALLVAGVALGRFKKTGNVFHGNDCPAPKASAKPSNAYVSPKNTNSRSAYVFPEDVNTSREKYEYLTTPGSPLLDNSYQLFFDEYTRPEKGGKIAESLTGIKTTHSVILAANHKLNQNVETLHTRKSMTVGMSIMYINSGYRIALTSHSSPQQVFEFDTWEKAKNWIVENL